MANVYALVGIFSILVALFWVDRAQGIAEKKWSQRGFKGNFELLYLAVLCGIPERWLNKGDSDGK